MSSNPWILGLGASHNGAACLLRGRQIVVAVQEERLLGVKRAWLRPSKPSLAIRYCLDAAGIGPEQLDLVSCCLLKRFDHAESNVYANPQLRLDERGTPALAITHHLGHAASAYGTSGWNHAAVLVVDGAGSHRDDLSEAERRVISDAIPGASETISVYEGNGTALAPLLKYTGSWLRPESADAVHGMQAFNSVGAMYSSVALQIFGNYMDAGKVMGLAPYGTPTIPIEEFVVVDRGHLRFTCEVVRRFQHDERYPACLQEYRDLAASVQRALEYALLHLVGQVRRLSASPNLALAGGVALNSVVNERIIRESGFRNVYIVPAAEDSGTAIGAAIYGLWHLAGANPRARLKRDSFGRSYGAAALNAAIDEAPFVSRIASAGVVEATVDLLCAGKTVGWFQGGSELGPRALGHRSILCDPRNPHAKDLLNGRVKYREDFRPFAPVVLLDRVHEWFETGGVDPASEFMLRVMPVRQDKRSRIPAVVHVDGTGRLQTVTRDVNGRYFEVVEEFFRRTGVPVLLNTSLNTRGEPIVESPDDALWCLLLSGLDCCVIEDAILVKAPGFRSPLDLVPTLLHGAVDVVLQRGIPVHARWTTRSSAVEIEIPTDIPNAYARWVDILPEIDGRSTGWDILERMSSRCPYKVDENTVVGLLARWRRMGAIALRKPDSTVRVLAVSGQSAEE